MHRRGIILLLGFLVAIVVAGGGGVSAPWQPTQATRTRQGPVSAAPAPVAGVQGRMRAW